MDLEKSIDLLHGALHYAVRQAASFERAAALQREERAEQSARAAAAEQRLSDLERTEFIHRRQLASGRNRLRRELQRRRAAEVDALRQRAAAKTAACRATRRFAEVRRHLVQARRKQAAAVRQAQLQSRFAVFAVRRAAQLRVAEEYQRRVAEQLSSQLAAALSRKCSAEAELAAVRREAELRPQAQAKARHQLYVLNTELAGVKLDAQRAIAAVNARAEAEVADCHAVLTMAERRCEQLQADAAAARQAADEAQAQRAACAQDAERWKARCEALQVRSHLISCHDRWLWSCYFPISHMPDFSCETQMFCAGLLSGW